MSALPQWPYPDDDPRSPNYRDTIILMPPERPRLPVNILQWEAQQRANRSFDRLMATIRMTRGEAQ